MNFLAHAYLSFEVPDILVGNLVADFVRGSQQHAFVRGIQTGLALHHAIDEFTDTHDATREANACMSAACGRYAGVFTDVIYDHFLALDPRYFVPETLSLFSRQVYQTLDGYLLVLPDRFRQVFFYMETQDWLSGYQFKEKIGHAFRGIYRRAKFLPESEAAMAAFEKNYDRLKDCARVFLPEVISFAAHFLDAERNLAER